MLQIFKALDEDIDKIKAQIKAAIAYLEGDKQLKEVVSEVAPVEAVVAPIVVAAVDAAVTEASATPTEPAK